MLQYANTHIEDIKLGVHFEKRKIRLGVEIKVGNITSPRFKKDYGAIEIRQVRGNHPSAYTRIAITFRYNRQY